MYPLLVGQGMSSLVPGMWSRAEGMSNLVQEMLSLAQTAGMVMLHGKLVSLITKLQYLIYISCKGTSLVRHEVVYAFDTTDIHLGRGQGPLLDYLPLLPGGSDLPLHRLEGHPHPAIASTPEMSPEMLLPQEDPL